MEDDHDEEVERVREWIDRLGAFASSLDAIEGDSATDFADNALEAWQHLALPTVTGVTLPALVIFGALNALAKASTTVVMDWADTPDVRDRYSRDSAQRIVKAALNATVGCPKACQEDDLVRVPVAGGIA